MKKTYVPPTIETKKLDAATFAGTYGLPSAGRRRRRRRRGRRTGDRD